MRVMTVSELIEYAEEHLRNGIDEAHVKALLYANVPDCPTQEVDKIVRVARAYIHPTVEDQ